MTPLHAVAGRHREGGGGGGSWRKFGANLIDVVRELMKGGADLRVQNLLGNTPLHTAAAHFNSGEFLPS